MSRDAILAKIRAAGAPREGRSDALRRESVARRLAERARSPVPERASGKSPDQLVRLFRGFLEGQSARVIAVADSAAVPAAVARYLRETNLPQRVRIGADARLAALPWQREPALEVRRGRAEPADEVGLTHAIAAVAETGTMLLASGADNPVTLNFLPETHVVVVDVRDLVGPYEDAFTLLRARLGEGVMPRTLNLISGPSRTGDIGGRIVQGAHGPRRMCVILVGG
jgi:L-lactate dehydrogenase complex protein LldG